MLLAVQRKPLRIIRILRAARNMHKILEKPERESG
jgi:hypothetical protein